MARADHQPKQRYRYLEDDEEKRRSYDARLPTRPKHVMSRMMIRHKEMLRNAKAAADEFLWEIDGKRYDRYHMMELLVLMVGEGMALADICADDRFPSLAEVRSWEKNHPQFAEDMSLAEMVRGEILAEHSLRVTMDLDEHGGEVTKNEITKAKLQHEALKEHAAYFNKRFVAKTINEVKDTTNELTEEQAKQRLAAIMKANPAIAETIMKSMPELGSVVSEVETSDAVVLENTDNLKQENETQSQDEEA